MRKKRNHDSGKKSSEKDVSYYTVPLQQEDTGEERDFSSDYATVEEQGGYSTVPLDSDYEVLNSSSASLQAMYAEIDKDSNKHEMPSIPMSVQIQRQNKHKMTT